MEERWKEEIISSVLTELTVLAGGEGKNRSDAWLVWVQIGNTFGDKYSWIFIKIKKCIYSLTQQFHTFRTNPRALLVSMHEEMGAVIFIAAFKIWGSSDWSGMISKITCAKSKMQNNMSSVLIFTEGATPPTHTHTFIWKDYRPINTGIHIWIWKGCLWQLIRENSLSCCLGRGIREREPAVERKLTFPLIFVC